MAKCQFCDKGVTFGIQVSHSHRGALEKILQMPVVRRVLYFFHTGQEIDV